MQTVFRKVRNFFYYLDQYVRLLANPRTKRRWAVLWGYLKIRVVEKLQPRRTKPLKLLGWRVHYGSLFFLRHTYREIFIERLYARHLPNGKVKRIIDAGANIGIATLWYRLEFPEAQIEAFEADPRTCAVMRQTIEQNQIDRVTVHEAAVAAEDGELEFFFDSALPAGDVAHSTNSEFRAALDDHPEVASHTVKAVALKSFLKQPVDILKVDIEGSEVPVLEAAKSELAHVRTIQMEYHYMPKKTLSELLAVLEQSGHHYRLYLDGSLENKLGSVAMVYSAAGELPE